MIIGDLDHVNLRTANQDPLVAFYTKILDMKVGPRPDFGGRPGTWLYAGVRPLIHVTVRGKAYKRGHPHVDHFAFSAQNMKTVLTRLRKHNVPYTTQVVDGSGIQQIFFFDPDGNMVELDFNADEPGDLTPFEGRPESVAAE